MEDWDMLDDLLAEREKTDPSAFIIEFPELPGITLLPDSITKYDEAELVNFIENNVKFEFIKYESNIPPLLSKIARYLDHAAPTCVIVGKDQKSMKEIIQINGVTVSDYVAYVALVSDTSMAITSPDAEHTMIVDPRCLLKLTNGKYHCSLDSQEDVPIKKKKYFIVFKRQIRL
jgi:hypothetical protein